MPQLTHYLPEVDEPERSLIQRLTGAMSHEDMQQFAIAYRQRRKDPQIVLLIGVIALLALPGLQRFWLGQIGMGFLYFFTGGLLWVGTIVDIVKHKELALRYNYQLAIQLANNLQSRNFYS
jgi:TM2 domain-containing membrane protein YozV